MGNATQPDRRWARHACRRWPLLLVALLLLAIPAAPAFGQIDDQVKRHPGYVNVSGLAELANDDGELIEVTLGPRMLKLFKGRAMRRHENSIAGILSELIAINAVVADVSDNEYEARKVIEDIGRRAEHAGWERFVRVRESNNSDIMAYMMPAENEDEVAGLLVVGFSEPSQFMFVNLVGAIDMERIFMLGDQFDLPGLDDLPPRSEIERRKSDPEWDGTVDITIKVAPEEGESNES